MTGRIRFKLTLLLLTALFMVGCARPQVSLADPPPAVKAAPVVVAEDTSEVDSSTNGSGIDLRNIFFDEDFMAESDSDKLESAASLLETARGSLESEQFIAAGYSFALARMMLAMVHSDSLHGEDSSYYYDLTADVEHFYDDYVAQTKVLPAESPPEAVIAGVEEAEGDTVATPDDLIPFFGTITDTTALSGAFTGGPSLPSVPLIRNRQVENAIKFFQTKGRKVFARWLTRAETNVPMMAKVMREEGLPPELVYLSMIESGFNNSAYSPAHAAGPWQFIKSTGKIFGLRTDNWYDERRDPVKATHAAARYLKKLYLQFDDWHLALAAYNCGELNVERRIARHKTNDFWKLSKLPRETRNYVPTYIAAAIMAQKPEDYGFEPVTYRPMQPVDSVLVTEAVDLRVAADLAGTDYATLKALNPPILRWCTPPNESVWLILPDSAAPVFSAGWDSLPPEKKLRRTIHIVRKGESATGIARKYHVSVSDLKAVAENKGLNWKRLAAGSEVVIPATPGGPSVTPQEAELDQQPPKPEKVTYTVRKGDTLGKIASKFGTTTSAIKKNNNLYKSSTIHPGQKLVIRSNRKGSQADDEPEKASVRSVEHKVKKGETWSSIARAYKVSVKELLAANDAGPMTILKVGRVLKIPER